MPISPHESGKNVEGPLKRPIFPVDLSGFLHGLLRALRNGHLSWDLLLSRAAQILIYRLAETLLVLSSWTIWTIRAVFMPSLSAGAGSEEQTGSGVLSSETMRPSEQLCNGDYNC